MLFVLYILVNLSRFIGVIIFFPTLSRGDYGGALACLLCVCNCVWVWLCVLRKQPTHTPTTKSLFSLPFILLQRCTHTHTQASTGGRLSS